MKRFIVLATAMVFLAGCGTSWYDSRMQDGYYMPDGTHVAKGTLYAKGTCQPAPEPVVAAPAPAAVAPAPVIVAPIPKAPAPAPTPAPLPVVVVEKAPFWDVHFAFGVATPLAKCKTKLDQIAKFMKDHPQAKLALNGHADIRTLVGQPLNAKLSSKRASNVMLELGKRGVDTGRLQEASFAADRPIAACPQRQPGKTTKDEEENCQKNRRVEVRVIKP